MNDRQIILKYPSQKDGHTGGGNPREAAGTRCRIEIIYLTLIMRMMLKTIITSIESVSVTGAILSAVRVIIL